MRIVYVTETYPPEINGVALTAFRTVRHLRAAGHEVQVVRPRQAGDAAMDGDDEWRTAGAPIPMYPDLRFGWATAGAFRRRWRERRPDLVHVTTPGPLPMAALRAARAEGVAATVDFRTNFHAYCGHYGIRWAAPWVLRHLRRLHALADRGFAPTDALADELRALGFGALEVVGRGVDAQMFSPHRRSPDLRAHWGAGDHDRVLLYVGRLAAEKNVAQVMRSAERLRAANPRLRVVMVGDGPLRRPLARAHPHVHFAGVQRGDALARCYASADVFVFPSRTETFGNVTLEAAASGLAVAAFDLAAARQHLADGVDACLAVPHADPSRAAEAFHDACVRALAMSDPHGPLRQAARRAALRADWTRVLTAFEARLHDVVARRALARPRHAAALA